MFIPFWCPEGHVFRYHNRLIRFEEALGDGIMRFRYIDGDEEVVFVPIGKGGAMGLPTVEWMIAAFRGGVVVDPQYHADVTDRRENVLHLDRPACEAIDPSTGWRYDWAIAAIREKIVKTDDGAKVWIAKNDHGGKKPHPRSLLRWMAKLKKRGYRIGALVSTAGRAQGESQLPDIEDRLVHKWSMRYWRPDTLNGRLADKDAAAAGLYGDWQALQEMGVPFLSEQEPSYETIRERINSLECYSTHVTRFGRPAADRMFSPAGEPVEVALPFERIFMDGVEWEHSVHYLDRLKLPVAKMKSTIAMDAFSQYVFPHPTFAGAFRPQFGLAALRAVMMPPVLTPEEIAEDPEAAMIYALPSDVMYDRDRTMIAPRMVPGAIKTFATVELAEAYHSDAKSKLENYHKFVKRTLSAIPGRILGPRAKHDIGYDPIRNTQLTRAQYVDAVEQCRRLWNSKPKKSLGNRSPMDVMKAFLTGGHARLTDPKEVMRTFASVPKKPCVLTDDGLIYDNVHYRFNREGTAKALSSNYHNTPFAKRIKASAKIEVWPRVWDDDIDMIEVYDEVNKEYFPMWSTDPGYTGGLNRWEHHIYQKELRAGGRGSITSRERLRRKSTHLDNLQKTLSGKSFREREKPIELLEAEERRLSGARAASPGCAQVPELHIPTHIDGAKREDIPMPPPQNKEEEMDSNGAEGSADLRSDPAKGIAEELGDADAMVEPSWTFSDDISDDEEEEE